MMIRTRQEESPLEVRRGREQGGMTQDALAALTGVPQSTIAAVENATRVLTLNLAQKLAKAWKDLDPLLFALEHVHWLESDLPLHTCTAKAKTDLSTFREAGVNTNDLGNRQLVLNAVKGVVQVANVVNCGGGAEFYISPGVLVEKDRQAATLKAQLHVNELKAQQKSEPAMYFPAPAILSREKQPFEIKAKLDRRRGMSVEDSKLKTAQSEIEVMPAAPSILLAKPKGGKEA